jgi:hypothetical protein
MFVPAAKENEIKVRVDDETFDSILAQCRVHKLRRAELVRKAVVEWLAKHENEIKPAERVA